MATRRARAHKSRLRGEARRAVCGARHPTSGAAVTGIEYLPKDERAQAPANALAERACRQPALFADPEFRFTLPLAPAGTAFRRKVWDALSDIPVGESRTYGEVARRLHTRARAIGGLRRRPDLAGHSCTASSAARAAGWLHGHDRRRPDRDQALAADARRLSLRPVSLCGPQPS
jgi:hypothetical protein